MARPYADDLRSRVSTAIALGETCRAIAEQFEIAPSTVVKWSKRLRETGSAAPAKFGGYRTCSLEPHREFLLAQIEAVSHLTLHWTSPGLVESHLLFPFRRPERSSNVVGLT